LDAVAGREEGRSLVEEENVANTLRDPSNKRKMNA
jgi:hypothetical protein